MTCCVDQIVPKHLCQVSDEMAGFSFKMGTVMDEFEARIKRDFLEEANELLDKLESDILYLKNRPDSISHSIDNLFRVAHTLKGSGHAAGIKGLDKIAHNLEILLESIRSGRIEVSHPMIESMLVITDQIHHAIRLLEKDLHAVIDHTESEKLVTQFIPQLDVKLGHSAASPISQEGFEIFSNIDTENQDSQNLATTAIGDSAASPISQEGLEIASDVDTENQDTQDVATSAARVKVLICDDDEMVRDVVGDAIKSDFIDICIATDGDQGMQIFQENDIDLVITDYKMPKKDGYSMAKEMIERASGVPIIIISAHADRNDIIDFLSTHIFCFIEKPFDIGFLQKVVEQAIRSRMMTKNAEKLSSLQFKAYMKYWNILSRLELLNEPSFAEDINFLETLLEEIGQRTRNLLDLREIKKA